MTAWQRDTRGDIGWVQLQHHFAAAPTWCEYLALIVHGHRCLYACRMALEHLGHGCGLSAKADPASHVDTHACVDPLVAAQQGCAHTGGLTAIG